MEKLDPLDVAGGHKEWCSNFRILDDSFPQKVKLGIIIWPSNSTPRYLLPQIENRHLNKNLYMNHHTRAIHNSQKDEQYHQLMNGLKKKVWYIHLWSIHKKECEVGNGKPLQFSCLGNPMGRGAWQKYSPWGHRESNTTEQALGIKRFEISKHATT